MQVAARAVKCFNYLNLRKITRLKRIWKLSEDTKEYLEIETKSKTKAEIKVF